MKQKLYSLDIETHDPYLTDKGVSWVYSEGEIIIVGLFNAATGRKSTLPGNGGKPVKKLLLDSAVVLIGANIVYDIGWLCYEHHLKAKEIKCGLIDVSIAEQCIDEYQPYSLDTLAWKYLQEKKGIGKLPAIAASKGLKGDFRKHLKTLWDMGFTSEIEDYVASDADQPIRIWLEQKKIIPSMQACEMNFRLIKIVLGMKQRGVRIDMAKRERNYQRLKEIHDRLQKDFEDRYGKVNFNSPKQLAELFDSEKVPYRCKIRIKGYKNEEVFSGNDLWDQRSRLKDVFNGVRVQKGQLVIFIPRQYAGRTSADLENMGYVVTCNPNIDKHALDKLRKTHEAAKAITDLKQVTSIIDKFMGPKFDRFIVKHGIDNYRIHADFNIVGARQDAFLLPIRIYSRFPQRQF